MRLFLFLLLSAVFPLPIQAASLRTLAWDTGVSKRDIWIVSGEKALQIENMHPLGRTTPISIPNSGEGLFLEAQDRQSKEAKPARIPLKIPAGASGNLLLLLLPDKTSPIGLRPLILKDDSETFPWGTFRVINTTGKPFVFRVEKKLLKVPPSWKPLSIALGGEGRNIEAALYNPDNDKRPVYSSIWEQNPGLRKLVFIANQENPALGTIDLKVITQSEKVEKAKKSASN